MDVIVGSSALKHFGVSRREPKDIDVWTTEDYTSKSGYDYFKVSQSIIDMMDIEDGFATPDTVYTMKLSHFAWDIHWKKTKLDIVWMESFGCQLNLDLFLALKELWKVEYNDKSFLSLNKTEDEFFNDFVDYTYDHDDLHVYAAEDGIPVYTECLKDDNQVLIDPVKFSMLSFEKRIQMFKEEIHVIACERWLHNQKFKCTIAVAYDYALKKTIISLTKNWANEFIILNLKHYLQPDYEMFNRILRNTDATIMQDADILNTIEEWDNIFRDSIQDVIEAFSVGELCTINLNMPSDEFCEIYGYEHLSIEHKDENVVGVFKFQDKIYKAELYVYSHIGYMSENITHTLREVKIVKKQVICYE